MPESYTTYYIAGLLRQASAAQARAYLGVGTSGGVDSLNGLVGNVLLAAGSNITFSIVGNTLTINATGGGGGITTATLPLVITGTDIAMPQAASGVNGFLSGTDWDTFNGKAAPLGYTPENVANKSTDVLLGASDTLYPTQKAVKTYADGTLTAAEALYNKSGMKAIVFCSAYTPLSSGGDIAEIVIPDASDGTSQAWDVKKILLRVNVAGGAPSVRIEKSTGTGVFSATTVGDVTLGSGDYEGEVTAALGTVASGDKMRFNVLTLGTATGWTVMVEIAPQ